MYSLMDDALWSFKIVPLLLSSRYDIIKLYYCFRYLLSTEMPSLIHLYKNRYQLNSLFFFVYFYFCCKTTHWNSNTLGTIEAERQPKNPNIWYFYWHNKEQRWATGMLYVACCMLHVPFSLSFIFFLNNNNDNNKICMEMTLWDSLFKHVY